MAVFLAFRCTTRCGLSHYFLLCSVEPNLWRYCVPQQETCIGHLDAKAVAAAWDLGFTGHSATIASFSPLRLYLRNPGHDGPFGLRRRRHQDAGVHSPRRMGKLGLWFVAGRRCLFFCHVVCGTCSGGGRVHGIRRKRDCQAVWFCRRGCERSSVLRPRSWLSVRCWIASRPLVLCWRHVRGHTALQRITPASSVWPLDDQCRDLPPKVGGCSDALYTRMIHKVEQIGRIEPRDRAVVSSRKPLARGR